MFNLVPHSSAKDVIFGAKPSGSVQLSLCSFTFSFIVPTFALIFSAAFSTGC